MSLSEDEEKRSWLEQVPALPRLRRRDPRPPRRCSPESSTFADGTAHRPAGSGRQRALHRRLGRARASSPGDDELARLGPGDLFGELSVIDQQPRAASALAEGATACLAARLVGPALDARAGQRSGA